MAPVSSDTRAASSGEPGAGYCMACSAGGKPPKSWMVSGCAIAVTPSPRVSQWADTITTPLGLPSCSPKAFQPSANSPPRAFMGDPCPKKIAGCFITLTVKFLGDLRDMLTLEACAIQLDLARHTRTVALGQGGRTIGRAANDLVHVHLACERIRQTDNHHAVVQEEVVQAAKGGFLTAVLGRRGGEGTPDLADQLALRPLAAGLIKEGAHLRCGRAKTGACADDDGVIVFQIGHSGDRGFLIHLVMGVACHFFRHGFRYALHIDNSAFNLTGTFGNSIGHLFDMALGRMIKHENPGHWELRKIEHCAIQ